MSVIKRQRFVAAVILSLLLFPLSLFAQTSAETQSLKEQLDRLQQQIDALSREARELRQKIEGVETSSPGAPSDDLTQVEPIDNKPAPIDPVPANAGTPVDPTPAGSLPADPINNVSNPAASKLFNPDISVIGNFLGHVGDDNPFDPRDSLSFDEAEITFEAFVDPYAKAKFYVAVTPEGAELEEGFINFIALPHDLTARVGKLKAMFGKANTWHTHSRPWVDQPLVIANFFGEEGLADSGISVSRILPNPLAYTEVTAEVFSGHAEIFDPASSNDLFYNAHLKLFRDLSENSNVELGTSFAHGTSTFGEEESFSGRNQFLGFDLTYRWKPLDSGTRRGFISRTEFIRNERADQSASGWGFYSSQDYQFARRWLAGVRFDRAAHADDLRISDRGIAATLTFRPSEFSQLRAELRRIAYGESITVNELLFQLQFAIGAHGAHPY